MWSVARLLPEIPLRFGHFYLFLSVASYWRALCWLLDNCRLAAPCSKTSLISWHLNVFFLFFCWDSFTTMLTCVRQRIALLFVPTDVQYLVTLRKIASSLNTQVSLKPELVSRWVSWSHWHSSIYGCPQQLLWPQYDWPYISWKLLTLAIQKSNRVDCKDHLVIYVVNFDEPGILSVVLTHVGY